MSINLKRVWEFITLRKTLQTFVYCGSFLSLGLLLAGLGPSLPTLGRNTNSPDSRMGATVTSRALGYLTGSISGPIFHKLPGNKMVALSLIFTSVVCFLIPHLKSLFWLCFLFLFQGLSMGMLDTGCNLMTLWMHQDNCDPYIQSLHAAFAVGAVIAPAVVKSFLAAQQPINWVWYGIGMSFVPWIAGLLYFPSPKEPQQEDSANAESSESSSLPKEPPIFAFSWENRWNVDYKPYLTVLGVALFLCCYVGGEVATGSFTTTFALRRHLSTEEGGAFLTFLFWLTFALGRLAAIPLSLVLSSKFMITVDLIGTFASSLMLWAFSTRYTAYAVSLVIYGLFMASTFPSAITLLQTIIPVTGNMTTVFIVGASLGEMLVPLLVSANFESTNYMSLIYIQVASVVAGTSVMIGVGILGYRILRERAARKQMIEKAKSAAAGNPTIELDVLKHRFSYELDPTGTGPTFGLNSSSVATQPDSMVKLEI